ncbi:hypothetical protein BKA67DRAFT_255501 [Truncatella angustata]|uniref:Uncharacterized protein n=1 Tax=Truncatella angustata TaxID=152316 RepID=A0A9P8UPL3_9PEZI|nr:uncharacterized protein BKA67DRAFT_255501 [Truncatella angustata]KAH6656101.1 hypothetical protein BKA67DRAFT_255501 [Truncatella angustata]
MWYLCDHGMWPACLSIVACCFKRPIGNFAYAVSARARSVSLVIQGLGLRRVTIPARTFSMTLSSDASQQSPVPPNIPVKGRYGKVSPLKQFGVMPTEGDYLLQSDDLYNIHWLEGRFCARMADHTIMYCLRKAATASSCYVSLCTWNMFAIHEDRRNIHPSIGEHGFFEMHITPLSVAHSCSGKQPLVTNRPDMALQMRMIQSSS